MNTILIDKLSTQITACQNCKKSGNAWADKWEERINEALKLLPHGSGIDCGVILEWDKCREDKVVFSFAFHHMDEQGFYDGWTSHELIITPSFLGGYKMRITGRDRNDIKDYLMEIFDTIFDISLPTDIRNEIAAR